MKGGLLLNNELKTIKTIQEAISMFQNREYATFQFLTNSSISCITFKSILKPDIISPFIEIRSDIFGKPVRSLLFKFFPIKNPDSLPDDNSDYFTTKFLRGNKNIIEIANESEIMKEYLLQLKIYQQTYNTISSAYEPVCPYPIHYEINLNKNNTIDNIINLLENTSNKNKITNEIMDTLGYESNMYVDTELKRRKTIFKLGCIVMEFMEDFVPLTDYIKKLSYQTSYQPYKKIDSFICYELSRLHSIGVLHGDIHLGNFMYNSKYKYITDGTNPEDLGRIIIIDFGRSKDNMESHITKLNQEVYKNYGKNAVGEKIKHYYMNESENIKKSYYKLFFFEFKKPYTFEYIYSKRLELTLKFRKTIINETITDINQFITEHPNKILINELQNKSNDFKLAFALLQIKPLYPQNFNTHSTDSTDVFLNDFIDNLNEKEEKIQKNFNITKKMKSKKTKYLEKMSELGLNTLKKLNTMVTKMFTKPKKGILIGGRKKNKLYNFLQYHDFTKKLKFKTLSKRYKELKKSKKK